MRIPIRVRVSVTIRIRRNVNHVILIATVAFSTAADCNAGPEATEIPEALTAGISAS